MRGGAGDPGAGRTARHEACEEPDGFTLHTLRGNEELDLSPRLPVHLQSQEEWVEELQHKVSTRVWGGSSRTHTHLVVVRRGHEDDGAIAGDVESPAGSYFAEEDVCYSLPKEEGRVVYYVGMLRNQFIVI